MDINFLKNKKILITGHTGFKGIWLSLLCHYAGGKIFGISKDIKNNKKFFNQIHNIYTKSFIFDLRDYKKLKRIISDINPDFIFHLAADALVIDSYEKPYETFHNNFLSSLSVLEVCREKDLKTSFVFITSDKSYKNIEKNKGYLETDILGGDDPYSGSKAAIEMLINSYKISFFQKYKNTKLAIARAGNVIGGGDFSSNRLVPDAFKHWSLSKKLIIRNPNATRPWQHVLEPLYGYILLAKKLSQKNFIGETFNFGPNKQKHISTFEIIKKLNILSLSFTKQNSYSIKNTKKKYSETNLLYLNSNKAKKKLSWQCILDINKTLKYTSDWYINYYKKNVNMYVFTINQIKDYLNEVKKTNS